MRREDLSGSQCHLDWPIGLIDCPAAAWRQQRPPPHPASRSTQTAAPLAVDRDRDRASSQLVALLTRCPRPLELRARADVEPTGQSQVDVGRTAARRRCRN